MTSDEFLLLLVEPVLVAMVVSVHGAQSEDRFGAGERPTARARSFFDLREPRALARAPGHHPGTDVIERDRRQGRGQHIVALDPATRLDPLDHGHRVLHLTGEVQERAAPDRAHILLLQPPVVRAELPPDRWPEHRRRCPPDGGRPSRTR